MKKQIILSILALAFILTITGAASAATTTNTTSDQYKIGQQVTQQALADTSLKLNQSDKNLVITTASTAKFKGKTTEDSVQAVVDKTNSLKDDQKITYGSGNLLIINDPNGPLWFTFISKTGTTLMAKTFTVSQNGKITATKTVKISTSQTNANFQKAITTLGTNGYNTATIANLWAAGAPADLLAITYSTGTIGQGNMINYAIIKQFQQNYPVSGKKCNYIFSTAGGYNDEAALEGEYNFSYQLYALNGGDPNIMGIMQYASDTKTGLTAIFEQNDLRNIYGSTVVAGTLSEIQFNNWLYKNYLSNSKNLNQLYNVVMLKNVDETAYKYLWYDDSLEYGHGLDENYIAGLSNLAAPFDQSKSVIPLTDINTMKQIGINAFTLASTNPDYLKLLGYTGTLAEMQAAFMTDLADGKIGAIATPYYMNFNGTSLLGLLDGINYSNAFDIHTLMTDTHPWNHAQGYLGILFFRVATLDPVNSANTVINKLMITVTPDSTGGFTYTPGTSGPGYINTMPLMFAQKAPWNMLRVFMKVGCPSRLQEDLDAATYGLGKYSLNQFEQYMLMSIPVTAASSSEENWTKNAAVRMGLFGVSPSLGTYLSSGGPMTTTNKPTQYAEYILIKWNSLTNTGIATLIQYDTEKMSELMAADGYTNSGNWHLDKVYKDSTNSYLNAMFSVVCEIPLTPDSFAALTGEGGGPVSYMSNYTSPTASADIGSGTYNTDQTITLTTSPGTTIYYTLDGTIPTLISAVYTAPIAITESRVLKYIAVDQNGYISPVYTQKYTIEKPAEPTNPTNPTNPTEPTNPTNPGENYPGTPTTVSAATETTINPTTTPAPTTSTTNPTSTPTNTSSNIPIGAIIGAIILAIAAIVTYLGRDIIIATIKGTGKPGK